MDHGAELEDRELPPVTAHALLQKKHRTGRCDPHCQADEHEDGYQNRQHGDHAGAIEKALGARFRPIAETPRR